MANSERKIFTQRIDLKTFESIIHGTAGEDPKVISNISQKTINAIKRSISNQTTWVNKFKELVIADNYQDAIDILDKNQNSLLLLQNEKLLDFLIKFKIDSLNAEQKEIHFKAIVNSLMMESDFGKIENIVDDYLQEALPELPINLKQTLNLLKANASAKNGKFNVANGFYKKVINSKDSAACDKAYALRGLGLISVSNDDILYYFTLSYQKFLEAGDRQQAVVDLLHLSSLHEKENPSEALRLLDVAIDVWSIEHELDKDFLAKLYHWKSRYLLSINSLEEALASAEKSSLLKEGLIGNEHSQFASYSLARLICKKLGYDEKAMFFSQKANEISTRIDSEEFRLQNAIGDCISRKEVISKPLLEKLEKSGSTRLIFSAYTYNATVSSFSHEEKINFCDKAKRLLEGLKGKQYVDEDYSLVYFTLGELYREEGDFKEAIKNYEQCLEHNPFYSPAIQNCSYVIWDIKDWNKSKDFFQKQILKLGESPSLCYFLGRSFYELENYQAALDYFMKARQGFENGEMDKYITACLDKGKGIKIDNVEQYKTDKELPPISLPEFIEVLKEFGQSISTNSRMHFWEHKNDEYKWASCPEEKGKQLLINVLQVKFGLNGIEIIQEVPIGAGIIDLYIRLRGGLNIVVELKVCGGSGYSSTYALSGTDQLVHYLQNKQTHIGFLIVFDGRRKDFSKGFKPIQLIGNFTIFTIAIDMNPKIVNK